MNIKIAIAGLSMACLMPLASQAQIVIQTPQIPGLKRVDPRPEVRQGEPEREEYWRRRQENEREAEWRRREEYRSEEHQRVEWQRDHCVRDWQNREYCRR